MTNLVEQINARLIEDDFPYCRIHKTDDDMWWATLVEHYSAETIFSRLQYAIEHNFFDWADPYFYHDTEIETFISFSTKQQLRNHFNL